MSLLTAGDLNPMSAFKLIKLIYTVAKQARVHRETCTEFASYVLVISNLLEPIRQSEQLVEHPAVQDALTMLHKNLVKAYLLIQKCEHSSTITSLIRHVPRKLKELEGEIQKVLSLLNLANLHFSMNITTNASSRDLSNAGTINYPDVASPALGESTSLQEESSQYVHIENRSVSLPSRLSQYPQGLATSQCLPARSLSITWGKDERYWKWVQRKGSSSNEVAYLHEVFWLEVRGQLDLATLKPGKYTLSWRLQVASLDKDDKPSGWESEPVIFNLSTKESIFPQHTEQSCFLVESSNKVENGNTSAESSNKVKNGSTSAESSNKVENGNTSAESSNKVKNGSTSAESSNKVENGNTSAEISNKVENENFSAVENGSGELFSGAWKDYEVGTFKVKKKQKPVELTFSLTEMNGGWKRGLFIDSVIINLCDEVSGSGSGFDEAISSHASASTSGGIEEFPNLPETISFSGHCHELKLMTDPYWFACAVCEANEQGLGYHCHRCLYDVHPECCISDHKFTTLLDMTDSDLSHWHWGNLLQLNKHRVEEKASRPKTVMYAEHPHLLKLIQNPYPSFICDARYCDGQGWVYKGWDGWIYRCERCDYDLHTDCRL